MHIDKIGSSAQPFNQHDFIKQSTTAGKQSMKENNGTTDDNIQKKEVKTVVSQLNDIMEPLRTNLEFKYHEELNEYYVTVVNPITNEVIKEIPPKKMLDMYAAMVGFMGILIDEKI